MLGRSLLLPPQHLKGFRVLVVEDDFFIADDLAMSLSRMGAEVIGPVGSFPEGLMAVVTAGRIDIAVLDINLRGEMSYPIADILLDRGIRVVLATGYDQSALPGRFAGIPRIEKPYEPDALAQALPALMRRHPPRPDRRPA